jgi:hypothetical protein
MLTLTPTLRLAPRPSPMLMLKRTPMLTLPRLLSGLLLAAAVTAWPAPARAAVGSWTSLLDGGPVWALAAHPTRRGWLFAGTKTNGVLRSTDSGATWQPANRGLDNRWVRAFAFDPANPSVIFAGLQDGDPALFKSTDGGNTWRPSAGGLSFNTVLSLAVDPRRPRTVYAAANFGLASGVFRSTDGGASWSARKTGLPAGGVDALAGSRLYAGTTGGLFASGDGGATWERLEGITTEPVLAVAAPAKGQVFAVQAVAGVHSSRDGGGTWMALNRGLNFFPANLLVVSEPLTAAALPVAAAELLLAPPRASRPAGPAATLYMGLDGAGLQSYGVP